MSLGAVVVQTRTPSQLGLASCCHAGFVLAAEGRMVLDPCGKVTHRGYKEGALPWRAFTSITEFRHPRGRILFLCTAIYFGGDSLLTWQKMDPTLQPPTQPCCVWSHGEKGTLREQKTRNLLQLLAQCQDHVCQLFQPDRTLLTTKVTHNPPLKAGLHDRNAYTAVAATSQMRCCLWTARIIWRNVPTFAVFSSFVETNESRLE